MNRFCFIVHPTSLIDVARYEPDAAGLDEATVRTLTEAMPPYPVAHISGIQTPDGRTIEGWFICAPLLPDQMLELPRSNVYEKILGAVKIGAELGAQIAGLGAFTGIVGDGGMTIAEHSPIGITTGNALTIATGVQSLLRGAQAMQIDVQTATVAVIGATGSIGSACVELLAPDVARILLVAPNRTRLETLQKNVTGRFAASFEISTDIADAVKRSDLVITATSATHELIAPHDLKIGAVVCELSLPRNVATRVEHMRPDVLVVEGGILRMPGAPHFERMNGGSGDFDLCLGNAGAFACMSETMVLALEGRFENYTLGRGISLDRVHEITRLAEGCGFILGDMRTFDVPVTRAMISAKLEAARMLSAKTVSARV